MRAYTPFDRSEFRYPEDMRKILAYLNEHGILQIQPNTVEELYGDFSESVYCAGWMGVDDRMLEEFADWLSEYEI